MKTCNLELYDELYVSRLALAKLTCFDETDIDIEEIADREISVSVKVVCQSLGTIEGCDSSLCWRNCVCRSCVSKSMDN